VTTKAQFSEQEWDQVLSGPPMAGMIVAMADHGGMMRETLAMAKAYGEARQQHGKSELLDEIVSAKPERDHTRFHSYDEMKRHGVQLLQEAVAILERKATADEVEDYRRFVLALARRVAERHKEGGAQISAGEQAALDDLAAALG
jgi:hypothetical protein